MPLLVPSGRGYRTSDGRPFEPREHLRLRSVQAAYPDREQHGLPTPGSLTTPLPWVTMIHHATALISAVVFSSAATAEVGTGFLSATECPDRIVYGDPAHPNRIVFLTEGKERVLHFERVAAVLHPDGGYTVHFPTFGRPEGMPMTLEFRAIPTRRGEGFEVRFNHMGGVHTDCMRIMPRVRWSDLPSEMEVLAFRAPGEGPARLTAEIRIQSPGDAPTGLIARIDTENVRLQPVSAGQARGRRLYTDRDGATDTVAVAGGSAVFHEGPGSLELEVVMENGSASGSTVHGVTGAPQVVATEAGRHLYLYRIHALSPDGLVYDEYVRERRSEPDPEAERILERPGAPRRYELDGAEWRGRVEIPSVVVVPALPHLVIGDETELRLAAAAAPLDAEALRPTVVRDLAPPRPGHVYIGYYPGHDLARPEYTETLTRGSDAPFVLRIQDGIRRPDGEAPPPEPESDPAVGAVLEILADMYEVLMALDPSDEAAFPVAITPVLERHGITLEREVTLADLEFMGQSQTPFFLAAHADEAVAEAFRQLEASHRRSIDAIYAELMAEVMAYDAELHLDAAGTPLRRSFRESNTDFTIEYRGDQVSITAANEAQGIDSLSVAVPPGTLDVLQWNEALSRLPLGDGFERTLTLFDLDVGVISSMGLGADGTGYSRRYVRATPTFSTATVRVTGRDVVEVHGERVPAFRVEIFFRGRPVHPAMSILGPEASTRGREGDPLVYRLRADAPHRVLTVDWRDMAVQRVLP
jgi:hypothetical protein